MPPSVPRSHIRSSSDENMVVTVIAVSLLAITVLGIGGYQFLQYQRERDQDRFNSRVYRSYVRNTEAVPEVAAQPLPTAAPQPSRMQLEQEMTRKLLAHPSVTPGAGFSAPGVKSTGVVIIDAIDQAQARAKTPNQGPPS